MPSPVWSRHPRFTLSILVALCMTTLVLLGQNNFQGGDSDSHLVISLKDDALFARLERADHIYNKVLKDRQGLIEKFGPTASDVVPFPPDQSPWPAYTIWDFFPPAFNCPHEVERIGDLGDGGKWVCGVSRIAKKKNCVIYSIGINHESSFEEDLLSRTKHCEVWGYDFSVNSMGPQISNSHKHRTHFAKVGLAGTDAHGPEVENKMYTLETLMKMNGHTHIDILKVDIESWEFETLKTLVSHYLAAGKPLPFGQLQLEIHIWNKSFREFLEWWELLEQAGLRPFMTEPNMVYQNYNKHGTPDLAEYSFLNVKGSNIFIKNPSPAMTST